MKHVPFACVDLSQRKPKKLMPDMQLHADWAVTMGCDDACPYVPTTVGAWSIADPFRRPLSEVRAIRDSTEAHIRARECLHKETGEVLEASS